MKPEWVNRAYVLRILKSSRETEAQRAVGIRPGLFIDLLLLVWRLVG